MAEFKEISPNASASAKLTNWFENRFPTAFDAYRVHMSEYYAPKNSNFWVHLWFAGTAGAGDPDRHRYLPGHALQA